MIDIVSKAEKLIAEARLSINVALEESVQHNIPGPWIASEFRTIGIMLPRRSGKTTVANQLQQRHSAVLLGAAHGRWPNNISLSGIVHELRGRSSQHNFNGLKYNLIILDDYHGSFSDLYKSITDLRLSNMLTHDYLILRLETPK